MSACDVCNGSGDYPVINQHGTHLYSIRCPECFGDGNGHEDETELKRNAADAVLRQKYAAAMEEMQGGQT